MSDVADVLRSARALYAGAPSHARQYDEIAEGTHCPLTAIYTAAAGGNQDGKDALDAADAASSVLQGVAGTDTLSAWNAACSTETVLAAFDAAIVKAGGS